MSALRSRDADAVRRTITETLEKGESTLVAMLAAQARGD
jgi:DNA-binding FadR family transcriptional regulator